MSDITRDDDNNFIPKINKVVTPLKRYKLDNAATIYSLIDNQKKPSVFRLSCTLKKNVNPNDLQIALNNIIFRFPYFDVNLKKGLFWAFWEKNPYEPKIVNESKYPCQSLPVYKRGVFPFRVKVKFNRIAVEFHHSVTDGTGGIAFLKALVAEYLHIRGVKTNDWGDIFRPHQTPHPDEFEYAYMNNYRKEIPTAKLKRRAFKPPLTSENMKRYHVTTGKVSVKELLKISRDLKVTITELLTAIYLESIQEILFNIPINYQKNQLKPIRIAVPVNLRNLFPSKTMRNFTFMVSPEINPKLGKYDFQEILHLVHHSIRQEVTKKAISQYITRNIKGEIFPLLRFLPLFVKRLFGNIIYESFGERLYSGKLSNLGKVTMPKSLTKEIINFEFLLAPSSTITSGCAVISWGDILTISFGRTVKEAYVEEYFFKKLTSLGLNVNIETN